MDQEKFGFVRKEILTQFIFFLGLFRSIMVFGIRGVICPSNWLTITGSCQWYNVAFELLLLAVAVLLLVLELVWDRDWKRLMQACRANWLVLGFVGLAGLSLIWSIQFNITLYKFTVLLGSSFMAIYIGHIFRLEKLIKNITWFYFVICFFSLFFVFFLPDYGIMSNPFYKGAWNGIFWNRNYLGCFMALGIALFLVNLLSIKKPRRGFFYLNLGLLTVASFLLVKSKSATGIISALVLVALVVVLYAWIKWGQKMKPAHYFGFLGVATIAFMIVMSNLNFFLGLLGRNSSLTGRVPVWEYLFQHVINQRPWLGYGYGAIWHLHGFGEELAQKFNWGFAVLIGDNGFIDIQLHLGIVGLSILLIMITLGFIRGIRYFLKERTMIDAFPILVLFFGVVANISLSLILETETLVWIVALATLVSIENKSHVKSLTLTNEGQG
ncbi:MAG: hypothetical protein Q7J07_10525 [Pelolinea sp.]|nr:hypothetical protein [Pelolinea sp.]